MGCFRHEREADVPIRYAEHANFLSTTLHADIFIAMVLLEAVDEDNSFSSPGFGPRTRTSLAAFFAGLVLVPVEVAGLEGVADSDREDRAKMCCYNSTFCSKHEQFAGKHKGSTEERVRKKESLRESCRPR